MSTTADLKIAFARYRRTRTSYDLDVCTRIACALEAAYLPAPADPVEAEVSALFRAWDIPAPRTRRGAARVLNGRLVTRGRAVRRVPRKAASK